ncbi:MAG TPA: hypothetical protein VGD56_20455 [Gemmatirosa sp.]
MPPRSPSRRAPTRSSAPPATVSDELRAKVLAVHARLCAEYRCPIGYFHDLDPLSELISSLLSHRTKNADSGRAFRQLRRAFPSWVAVRDAPVADVQAAITPATWPEQKAPRIQATLREITTRLAGAANTAPDADPLGDGALDFLGALPVRDARDWLESIPGVGPKTSAAVLAFSRLRRPALPVDSHHHRVATRLGLIPEHVDVGPAHAWLEAQLPPDWDPQQVYDNHEVLMLHGQHVCFWREPACARCVVLDLCPTGQARLGQARLGEAPLGAHAGTRLAPEPDPTRPTLFDFSAADAAGAASMPVHPHPDAAPAPERGDHSTQGGSPAQPEHGEITAADHERLRRVHADPDQLNAEAREQAAKRQAPDDDVQNPEHYRLAPEDRAHGTHGKGFSDENRANDEVAIDSGDDPQFRHGGASPDEAPDPTKFAKNSDGRMGGPGWGNEQVGGSTVDRRPNDSHA